MKLFAVTGNPILHSKSPNIFNYIFNKKKINAKYIRLSVDSAKEAISLFKELRLSGMNVTAPFKEDIIQYLDEIDETAKQIGSVNTIIERKGKLIGYNTDIFGVSNTLKDYKNKTVIVLGAGGASKAVIYSLKNKAKNIVIYNRTEEKAISLSKKFNINFCKKNYLEKAIKSSDIIINTLPSKIKVIDDNWINSKHIIIDAIYNNSVYKEISNKKNIEFYDGKHWLLNQALPAFELFFNKQISLNIDIFNDFTKPKDKIIFIGFMGSGKTAISKIVSEKLSCKLFCTDDIISNKESLSINDIFEQKGEQYFREIEQEILKMLSNMDGKGLISTGGGIILNEANRKIIADNYTSVWLYANTEAIMSRTKPDNRPLLKNNFTKEFIQKMMNERKELYFQSCDLLINTNNKSIKEIADKLVNSELQDFKLY